MVESSTGERAMDKSDLVLLLKEANHPLRPGYRLKYQLITSTNKDNIHLKVKMGRICENTKVQRIQFKIHTNWGK